MSAALRRSVSSLEIFNYRRYFAGQVVCLSGNWMQMVAEMWLILELTGSGVAVGVTSALQFLPILIFGAWGGVIADRFAKRKLLIATQSAMAVPAVALFALTATGVVEPWMVFALVFVRGSINAIDNPTRQSFVIEMVGADQVVNAVGLNSVIVHSARIFGPAGAGLMIATVGIAPCFLVNTATFAAMIVALRTMDPGRLAEPPRPDADEGGVGAAIRYVRSEPTLLIPLLMMIVVGTLAFNFQVLLPLLGRFTFDGGPGAYSALAVAMAVGSIAGALAAGARGRVSERLIVGSAAGFGISTILVAAAPTLPLAMAAFVPLGAVSVTFAAAINSTLQLDASPQMRGRVMALYSVVFLGSTPIGGPLVGGLAETFGPRAGLVLGGIAALAAAIGGAIAYARRSGVEPLPRLRPLAAFRRGAIALPGAGSGWRLRTRRAVAVEPGRTDQLDRLEGRRGLDVEADAVALLDRQHGGLAATPEQRDQDRVAGADAGYLRPDPAGNPRCERKCADRPKAAEGDSRRRLGRQAGRGSRRGQGASHRLAGPVRAAEGKARRRRDQPPASGDEQRQRLTVAIGDGDADDAEHGRDPGDE